MGRQARPLEGNRIVGQAPVLFDGVADQEVGLRVEGAGPRRLDLGHGGVHIRRARKFRLRNRGIDRIEVMGADQGGIIVPRNGEMRRFAALGQGRGWIQGRTGPFVAHGVGDTDGVAGRPFDGLSGPAGAGFHRRAFRRESEACHGRLGILLTAQEGEDRRGGRNQQLSHGVSPGLQG